MLEDETSDSNLAIAAARLPYADIGNGDRFVLRYGNVFRYVTGRGWLHFDGSRWTTVGARDAAFEAAKNVAQRIQEEESEYSSRVELRNWLHRSQNMTRLLGMMSCARTRLLAAPDQFDRDKLAVGVPNGLIVFERDARSKVEIRFRPSDAADYITRQAATPYDAEALAPLWDRHLARVQPDPEMRRYLQRCFGYLLLGSTREQAFFIHIGAGGDGKSTTINTLANVIGDYAAAVDVNLLLARKSVKDADAPKTALASLAGDVRMAFASEPPTHARLNEGLIKQITGGAPIKARFNYKDPFEFSPRFKLVLECNSLPLVVGHDDGIWRRIRVIPWPVQIPKQEQDVDLEDKLRTEAPGILRWLVDGAQQYLTDRLNPEPAVVREATSAYRKSSNSVIGWLEECVDLNDNYGAAETDLWMHYKQYCAERGARQVTRRSLFEQLSRRGVHRSNTKHSRTRRVLAIGCRIKPDMQNEARAAHLSR